MSSDDYDDRQRDSNDYLRCRHEQLDFEDMLAKRHDAVHEAIRKKDYSRAASEFGAVSSEPSGIYVDNSGAFEARNKPQTVYEQWLRHKTRLIIKLESSNFLPTDVTQQWIRKIKQLNIFQPPRGLEEVDELHADYLYTVDQYKPQHDISDMAVANTIQLKKEMHDIMHELDRLKVILKHVDI